MTPPPGTWILVEGAEPPWRRVADDGRILVEDAEPAIGYCQAGRDEDADVVALITGGLAAVQTWRDGMKARRKADRIAREVLGEPRVLSSTTWDPAVLNAACGSDGALWRLLRKERLL